MGVRRGIIRYVAVDGCGDLGEAAEAIRGSVRALMGLLGSAKVRVEPIGSEGGACELRIRLYGASLLEAALLAIALTKVGASYLRPLATSGTLRGLRDKVKRRSAEPREGMTPTAPD